MYSTTEKQACVIAPTKREHVKIPHFPSCSHFLAHVAPQKAYEAPFSSIHLLIFCQGMFLCPLLREPEDDVAAAPLYLLTARRSS